MRLVSLAVAAFLASCICATAQTPSTAQTLTVSGFGEAQMKPDYARITVTAATQADTIQQAVDANRAATERVLTRLQALAVKREDIQTTSAQVFQTPARLGPDGREIPTPRFTANHQILVTSRDLDGVGRLVGAILASGDMTLQGVVFGLDKSEAGEDEAQRNAVRDARRQAEVLAAAAEVKLGRLREIRNVGGPRRPLENGMARMALASEDFPMLPPATVRAQANVEMVWEIAP